MSRVRPLAFTSLCVDGAMVSLVSITEALRYANERVTEALCLAMEYAASLEPELASQAFIDHCGDRQCGPEAHNLSGVGATPTTASTLEHTRAAEPQSEGGGGNGTQPPMRHGSAQAFQHAQCAASIAPSAALPVDRFPELDHAGEFR